MFPNVRGSIYSLSSPGLIKICSDEEKLQVSLQRFFRKLAVDKPVARNNYLVQISPPPSDTPSVDPDELAWGENVLGPEDEYGGTKGSSFGRPPVLVVTPQTLRFVFLVILFVQAIPTQTDCA